MEPVVKVTKYCELSLVNSCIFYVKQKANRESIKPWLNPPFFQIVVKIYTWMKYMDYFIEHTAPAC